MESHIVARGQVISISPSLLELYVTLSFQHLIKNTFFKIFFIFKSSLQPAVGLELITPRSKVSRSTD